MKDPYWTVTIVYDFDDIDPISWKFDFQIARGGGIAEMIGAMLDAFIDAASGVERAVDEMVGDYRSRTITFEAVGMHERHRMSIELGNDVTEDQAMVAAMQMLNAITSATILEIFREHCNGA